MATYDVLNEAAVAATPAEIVGALLEEAAGRSRWWQPFLEMRQRGDKPLPEIGAVVDIAVSVAGLSGRRLAAAHFSARVSAFQPGRRLVLEYFEGDFRGTEEWTLDPVDAGHTRIATRWKTDPQGMVRLLARLADVPGSYSKVMQEGFRGIERFAAERRSGSQLLPRQKRALGGDVGSLAVSAQARWSGIGTLAGNGPGSGRAGGRTRTRAGRAPARWRLPPQVTSS